MLLEKLEEGALTGKTIFQKDWNKKLIKHFPMKGIENHETVKKPGQWNDPAFGFSSLHN